MIDPYAGLDEKDWLKSIWQALVRLEELIVPVTLPAPVVNVDPPDLADIVTAVTALKPGPSAEEIARAIAESLRFPTPEPDESLAKVALSLEKLSNQLKGIGNMGRGGGTARIDPESLDKLTPSVSRSTNVVTVPASVAPVELGANMSTRVAMTVFNEIGASRMYLKFGSGASETSYSNVLEAGDYWESTPPLYAGPVTAVWAAPLAGGAKITEFLP